MQETPDCPAYARKGNPAFSSVLKYKKFTVLKEHYKVLPAAKSLLRFS